MMYFRILLWMSVILSAGCMNAHTRHEQADNIVNNTGFVHEVFTTGQFNITTYRKLGSTDDNLLAVYIEGDGYAFYRKGRQSSDPTPRSPVGLELAVRDLHPSVLYIARPCQYLPSNQLQNCDARYWSTHRYSEEAVTAINEIIDKAAPGYHRIGLIGYSGGGTIATLLAARRNDIAWLVTVTANLDHKLWTRLHGVTPLSGSLNAADYAGKIAELPQLHLAGEKDRTVPLSVIQSYMSRAAADEVRLEIIPGYDHKCCWVRDWPGLLCKISPDYCAH